MSLVVPFDGRPLAEAALVRATEFAEVFDERVVAVAVVPEDNAEYAREHGWLEPGEEFDREAIVASLHEQVARLAPEADFVHEVVGRYTPSGGIARRLRRIAKEADASMVFVGSENAGHVVSSLGSVGENVAADDAYDVVIVRQRSPSRVSELREASPHRRRKSNFYAPK
jgi:nucleotide-binding universal stress UspA family protein